MSLFFSDPTFSNWCSDFVKFFFNIVFSILKDAFSLLKVVFSFDNDEIVLSCSRQRTFSSSKWDDVCVIELATEPALTSASLGIFTSGLSSKQN